MLAIDCLIQSQLAHKLVHDPDTATTNGTRSFGNLVVSVGVFEHRRWLILELLPFQPRFKILLVSEVGFMVSFVHLECAPIDCTSYMQSPITTNNDARSGVVSPFLAKNHAGLWPRTQCDLSR